jgi:hypothetical protein
MKMQIWHYSGLFVLITVIGVFTLTAAGAAGISAILFLLVWPAGLVWFGWSLKCRQIQQETMKDKEAVVRYRRLKKSGKLTDV